MGMGRWNWMYIYPSNAISFLIHNCDDVGIIKKKVLETKN
jgi:hypothetical protein